MDRMNANHGMHLPAGTIPQLNHNPPPQIFGGYTPDGSPLVPHGLPDYPGPLFTDGTNFLDDSNEVKRRRIARACDMCRKKKIKCDGKIPCTHCVNYKTECVFTHVEKKRNPPKGAKYIEGLENRLGRMEHLLRLSGLLDDNDNGKMDLGTLEKRLSDQQKNTSRRASTALSNPPTSPSHSTPGKDGNNDSPNSSLTSPEPQKEQLPKKEENSIDEQTEKKKEEEVEELSDMMCSLVTNNCGETRYIGSSSGFSIFSPKGIQWVNEKTGDSSFQQMITSASVDENKWVYWKPEIFGDLFARKVYKKLPPKAEAVSLLRDFFENFNCMFPLFHQPTFMHLFELQYSNQPYEGSGWWASLNIALALAHRLRVMSQLVPQEEDESAWLYLKNAMSVFTELSMRNTDLLSIQALLGMALFLQGTPNPQPSFFLVAAAIRLSHSIGLHKRGSGFNLNPVEMEQRKRVFWIGYMLDKDICLRSGRPPAQDDDDMNVDLPSADPDDNIGNIPLSDGKGKVNLFRLMSEFATIESKVYKQLYATKATKQTDGELLNTIGQLDQLLEEWKDSIPVDFRPEHEIKASHTPLILHIVVLHFAYYNCLTTIHRMSVHHGYWTSRLSNFALQGLNARPLNPRVFSSAALCVSAARASIHLIKYIPQGDFACVWLILYFPVSALVTLFGNILQNPQDPRARSDVRLMNLVVNFLSMLGTEEENGGVKRMLGVCAEFERIAKVVVDKAEKELSSKRKRKGHDSDKAGGSSLKNSMMPTPPSSTNTQNPSMVFSPPMSSTNGFSPGMTSGTSPTPAPWVPDYGLGEGSNEYLLAGSMTPFADLNQYYDGSGASSMGMGVGGVPVSAMSPLNMNTFQQPPVPQDFWNMPMTIEYDWADMIGGGGGGYAGFENGGLGMGDGMAGVMDNGGGRGQGASNGNGGGGGGGNRQHGNGDGDGGGGQG